MASSKLSLIAKLSGSFAVSGAISQASSSEWSTSAGLLSGILPSTAHCVALWGESTVKPVTRPKPYPIMKDGRIVKVYPVGVMKKHPVWSQLTFYSLKIAALKGSLFAYHDLLIEYVNSAQNAEYEADQRGEEFDVSMLPDFPVEEAKRRLPRALFCFLREIVTGVVRAFLTGLAIDKLDSRLAWKLVKDQAASWRAKKVYPFYQRPLLVARTYLRGAVIPAVAELVVNISIEIASVVYGTKLSQNEKAIYLHRRIATLSTRSIVNLTIGAAGAGAFAIITPGFFCGIASAAASLAGDFYITGPAVELYMREGKFPENFKWVALGSAAIAALCFVDWLPDTQYNIVHIPNNFALR